MVLAEAAKERKHGRTAFACSSGVPDAGGRHAAPAAGWLRCALPVLIAGLTFTVFLPALQNHFVDWDDYGFVVDNTKFRGFGAAQLKWMFTAYLGGNYQPLTWVSYAIDYHMWGIADATGYHLTNNVLHAVNAVLFYALALRLLKLVFAPQVATRGLYLSAALAALLFGLHPLRVESVAWVTERRDVLSVAFLLPCVLLYFRYALGESPRWLWYAGALMFLTLSLLSKAWGVTLPLLLLVFDTYPLRRLRTRSAGPAVPSPSMLVLEKLPFFLVAACFAVQAARAQAAAGLAMLALADHSVYQRMAQAAYGLVFYIWKTIVPLGLSPLYEIPPRMNPLELRFVVCGVIAAAGVAILLLLRKRWPAGPALLACYVLPLAPVLGFVQCGPQLVADRYSYIAGMALAVLAAAGWYCGQQVLRRRWRGGTALAAVGPLVVLFVLGVLTRQQNAVWRDADSLWTYVAGVDPANRLAQFNLAVESAKRGDNERAAALFEHVLALDPKYASAYGSLGHLRQQQGRRPEAIALFQKGLALIWNQPKIHGWLGVALRDVGRTDEAVRHFDEANRLEADPGAACRWRGLALVTQGRVDEALPHFRAAVEGDPNDIGARYDFGLALAALGRLQEAVQQFEDCLRRDPARYEFQSSLAKSLESLGERDRAIAEYQGALRMRPGAREPLLRLANLLLQGGRAPEAVTLWRDALAVDPRDYEAANHLAWLLATTADPGVRDGAEAVRLAEAACQATQFREARFLSTLAGAYAAAGRFPEAIEMLRRIIPQAEASGNQALLSELNRRLALYQVGRADGDGG